MDVEEEQDEETIKVEPVLKLYVRSFFIRVCNLWLKDRRTNQHLFGWDDGASPIDNNL